MAGNISTLTLASRVNMQVTGLIAALDVDIIGRETAKTLQRLKNLSGDMRLDVRDWEMADSRSEMVKHATAGLKRIDELRTHILKASEHGIFSSLDVVDLSSQLDAIQTELR